MSKQKRAEEQASRGLARLPPGRHGIPPEVVAENQRERLTAAAVATFGELGYNDTTITKILEAAGVSTRTFYENFSDKQACFLATYELVADYLGEAVAVAGSEDDPWPDRVRARIDALLDAFAANPALASFALIAPATAGGDVADRQRRFGADLLAALLAGYPEPQPGFSEATEQAMVGGMVALIADQVEMGEGEGMDRLAPQLLALLLTPYLGRDEAFRLAREGSAA